MLKSAKGMGSHCQFSPSFERVKTAMDTVGRAAIWGTKYNSRDQVTTLPWYHVVQSRYSLVVFWLLTAVFVSDYARQEALIMCDIYVDQQTKRDRMNSYCLTAGTFSLRSRLYEDPDGNNIWPGVGPATRGVDPEEDKLHHHYYHFVGAITLFMGPCFMLPYGLWKLMEGRIIRQFTTNVRNTFRVGGGALADPDEKRSLLNLAVALFEARGEFAFYTLKYYVCSLLQTAVYLGTGFFLYLIFGAKCLTYGYDYLLYEVGEIGYNPMEVMFPKLAKCNLGSFGPSGTKERHDAACTLTMNAVNQKLFLVIWVWLAILAPIVAWGISVDFLTFTSSHFRAWLVLPGTSFFRNEKNYAKAKFYLNRLPFADWFVLYLIKGNLSVIVYAELINQALKISGISDVELGGQGSSKSRKQVVGPSDGGEEGEDVSPFISVASSSVEISLPRRMKKAVQAKMQKMKKKKKSANVNVAKQE